jgi:hypothetical protein
MKPMMGSGNDSPCRPAAAALIGQGEADLRAPMQWRAVLQPTTTPADGPDPGRPPDLLRGARRADQEIAMRSVTSPEAEEDLRDRLPAYGQPADATVGRIPVRRRWRTDDPPRRHSSIGAWLLALGLGAAITVIAVASLQDPRSLGTQVDDTIASVRDFGNRMGQTVTDSQNAAVQASRDAVGGVGTAIDDTGISLKVKTALAADPALSAARIEVTTKDGIVRLEGPAPDAVAKARATVLAGAPQGVRGVDNRLALPQASRVVAVADGTLQQALPAASATR